MGLMQARSLHIHIDRLTLEGKTPREGRSIVAAIERRLTELANRAPASLLTINAANSATNYAPIQRMDAGTVAHGASADAIGSHIATQVFRKLGGLDNA